MIGNIFRLGICEFWLLCLAGYVHFFFFSVEREKVLYLVSEIKLLTSHTRCILSVTQFVLARLLLGISGVSISKFLARGECKGENVVICFSGGKV